MNTNDFGHREPWRRHREPQRRHTEYIESRRVSPCGSLWLSPYDYDYFEHHKIQKLKIIAPKPAMAN
jgi:hypothetical protein